LRQLLRRSSHDPNMGEAPVAIKIDHGLLRVLRGITVYVKGRTLLPLDFATAHIAATNRVSMTWIKFWRVTEKDAASVFLSGGINGTHATKHCHYIKQPK